MIPYQRLEEILKYLEKHGSGDVSLLSELFNVTGKTIRQDLNKMEKMGLVTRVRGGAVLRKSENGIFPIEGRKKENLLEKDRIARAALDYIEEDDVLILDGGSTTLPLARLLGSERVIVLTNDLAIANELRDKEAVTLYLTGGKLRRESVYTLLGRDAEASVRKYHAHKLFLATSALDIQQGLTVFSEEEAEIKKAMITASKQVICLADYSKFHKSAFVPFAAMEDLDVIITDERISEEDRRLLETKGTRVIVARVD